MSDVVLKTLKIKDLAGLGDGIAIHNGQRIYVPLTLPGDVIKADVRGERGKLVEVIEPSVQRRKAPCKHFGECGGCSLQHLTPDAYAEFKENQLFRAIDRAECDATLMEEMHVLGERARRRVELKVQRDKEQVRLGFFQVGSHDVVDISECLIADTALVALIAPLRVLLSSFKKPGRVEAIQLASYASGVDVVFVLRAPLEHKDKEQLNTWAQSAESVLRLVMKQDKALEVVFQREAPMVQLGDVRVEVPVGAFAQATAQGQDILTQLVCEAVPPKSKVADFYAGCGTYSFPLAQKGHEVFAYECDDDMVMAASNAVRQAGLESRVTFEKRDLVKCPVKAVELKHMDVVVVNPPRAGAMIQVQKIADAKVKRVVMVSCNPATLSRDIRHLKQAGYALNKAVPVDQFYWSAHLEAVAILDYVGNE